MGACTVTAPLYGNIPQNLGQVYWVDGWDVQMSASYATGGDTITPQQFGLGSTISAVIIGTDQATQAGFFLFQYNRVNRTVQAFTAAAAPGPTVALVEVTAGTNLSAYHFGAVVMGI